MARLYHTGDRPARWLRANRHGGCRWQANRHLQPVRSRRRCSSAANEPVGAVAQWRDLPAASAAFFAIGAYEELEVLAEQSEQMHEALSSAQTRIERMIRVDRPLAS
jgi:hypothetical protein